MGQISRREFLHYAAAGAAVAGLGSKHARQLISPVEPVPHGQAGLPTVYATTCRECPAGCGMHVWNREGRAVKAEGNPDHPISRGGLCARGQSALQGLYDPDRLKTVLRRGDDGQQVPADWTTALAAIAARLKEKRGRVLVLTDLQTGTLDEVMRAFTRQFGGTEPVCYEPVSYSALWRAYGYQTSVGNRIPRFHLADARLIISFAADFLETWISPVEYTAGFARMREFRNGDMGRFLYIGPWQSMTAANADEFWKVPPDRVQHVAFALLHEVLGGGRIPKERAEVAGSLAAPYDIAGAAARAGIDPAKLRRLAELFCQDAPTVALAGPAVADSAAAYETALATALLNYVAGRLGQTVQMGHPHALSRVSNERPMGEFLSSLGSDDVLIVHQANPIYSLAGASEALARAGIVIYLGTMLDETARLAQWVLPIDSPLESWGDYEPYSGLLGLLQPVTGRLYDTRLAGDVLLELAARAEKPLKGDAGAPGGSFQEWRQRHLERVSKQAAVDGRQAERLGFADVGLAVTAEPRAPVIPHIAPAAQTRQAKAALGQNEGQLWLYPSIMLFDGRGANRGWLQEAPDPVSYAVWGSWADMHPKKALSLGLRQGDVVELRSGRGAIEVPVRLNEAQDPAVVAVGLGQGHTALGQFAAGVGANAFALLGEPGAGEVFPRVQIARTGRRNELVAATATTDQHGRDILHWTTAAELAKGEPGDELFMPLPEGYIKSRDLYGPHTYKTHRWAMVVDLHRCVGCGACAVACYAENNLPVVGREKIGQGRGLPWLQVLPYRHDDDRSRLGWLPLLCQQCDAAPCEPVCPVFAAVHNEEGLNAQVYNRCVGTRYCNNNCPYKVRRFNWGNPQWPSPLERQLNPDVSVRSRGVMEKCTFCIQRIQAAKYRAKLEGRPVRDGEIQPACVQSCPARVYTFGDLLDPKAQVTQLIRHDGRRYQVLRELNTKPAVIYLKRIQASVTT